MDLHPLALFPVANALGLARHKNMNDLLSVVLWVIYVGGIAEWEILIREPHEIHRDFVPTT
jgi:hypothetical protein